VDTLVGKRDKILIKYLRIEKGITKGLKENFEGSSDEMTLLFK